MDLAKLFENHVSRLCTIYENAMSELETEARLRIDAILIHSGSEHIYFEDDRHVPFQGFGHFHHWLPMERPDQMVLYQAGKKPTYFEVVPKDFWYEQSAEREAWWADQFDIVNLASADQVLDHLPATRRIAFLGENLNFAANLGLPANLTNHRLFKNYLDYYRSMKTEYEVAQLREANRLALIGHRAAYESFVDFGSEWDIHMAYLAANRMIEHDSPYTNIVGLDEKSAILHYQNKRRRSGQDSKLLLIDAGLRYRGYCSDITRTYLRQGQHPVFANLVKEVEALELKLAADAHADMPYLAIHQAAHAGILDILIDSQLCRGSREELESKKVSSLFFPHGIGHLLGLQVHDVGGHFKDKSGDLKLPPTEHPFLRLNRNILEGMVFTIEPGLYFIPVLLDPERQSPRGALLNWKLIDTLLPYGGIRFEDNILVTKEGSVNLTRP